MHYVFYFVLLNRMIFVFVWQLMLLRLCIVAVLAVIGWTLHKKKVNRLKNENALLNQNLEHSNELLAYARQNEERAKEEAELCYRLKSQLLAQLSHEIRTPMNGVIGMVSLLAETPLSAEQFDYAESIKSSSEKLMTTINDMLTSDIMDFSENGNGRVELENKDFDLRFAIEEVLEVFAKKAANEGLELLYKLDENVPQQVVGDDLRLRQILMNLVENAVKFTFKGEVLIAVHVLRTFEGNQVELGFEVRDTGVGIPTNKLESLVANISNKNVLVNKQEGNGIGLSISGRLVSLMGGKLKIESSEGVGTSVRFSINARASLQPLRNNINHDASFVGKKVLIVDDNINCLSILRYQLKQWNLSASIAISGAEALNELLSCEFDMVIIDKNMQRMNGLQLAQIIHERKPQLPLVLLKPNDDELSKEYVDVFAASLKKPIRYNQLYKCLASKFKELEKASATTIIKPKLQEDFSKHYPLRILVTEDDKINQKIALKVLNKLGYKPDLAANGKEALEMVGDGDYDVILMDVQMPVMDGLEATRMMRLCLNTQPVIIAMTANAMQGDRELCITAGMNDYVSKPVRVEDLEAALNRAFDEREMMVFAK